MVQMIPNPCFGSKVGAGLQSLENVQVFVHGLVSHRPAPGTVDGDRLKRAVQLRQITTVDRIMKRTSEQVGNLVSVLQGSSLL